MKSKQTHLLSNLLTAVLGILIDRGVVLDGSYPLREAARRHGPAESDIGQSWGLVNCSELAVRSMYETIWLGHYIQLPNQLVSN